MAEPEYDRKRRAQQQRIVGAYPDAAEVLDWNRDQIAEYQTQRLRWLIDQAQGAPFWRDRLAGVNSETFSLESLNSLPILTKRKMMDNWSELITLPGIARETAYEFLDSLDEDRYFHETYHLVASGGSSGEPALFLYDWDGWAGCAAPSGRYSRRLISQYPELTREPGVSANVGAGRASHMTYALGSTFSPPGGLSNYLSVSQPLADIVEKLNGLQPARLSGYPSMMLLLTEEQKAGRLKINPHTVQPSSEPLTPEIRQALVDTWNPIVMNIWGCSEACCVANSYGNDAGMYVNEDFAIVEPVDRDNRPVPPGVVSDKVLITNLFNAAQPLIRYELTDQVTVIPEPSPSGIPFFRISDIEGRTDDVLQYGEVSVHPLLFRGPLARTSGLLEFQIRQTSRGADVDYLATDEVDTVSLKAELTAALASAGLAGPVVNLRRCDQLERVGVGKLKRFFPLESARQRPGLL